QPRGRGHLAIRATDGHQLVALPEPPVDGCGAAGQDMLDGDLAPAGLPPNPNPAIARRAGGERGQGPAGGRLPQHHGAIVAARGEGLAVAGECQGADRGDVAVQPAPPGLVTPPPKEMPLEPAQVVLAGPGQQLAQLLAGPDHLTGLP